MFDPKIPPFNWIFDPFTEKPDSIFVFRTRDSQDVLKVKDPSDELKKYIKCSCALSELLEVLKAARACLQSKSKKEDVKTLEKLAEAVETLDKRHGDG